MRLTFTLDNKEFQDALAVSVNEKTKELTKEEKQVSFDVPDADRIEVHIEYKTNDIKRIKNPIGRFFAYLLFFLLSTIIFFADNDPGIKTHKFFYDANPFDLKKTFKIASTENTVILKYVASKYDKQSKRFSAPDIEVTALEITDELHFIKYDQASLKKEFRLYHYPAYTVLFVIILALAALMVSALLNQFSPFDLFGVIGMSFCCAVMLALLIVFTCLFVSTHKLFRQIDRNLAKDLSEKQEI